MKKLGGKKFYAVVRGRIPGIYETWADCQKQVDGFQAARFKSFPTVDEAQVFIQYDGNVPESTQVVKRKIDEVIKEEITKKKILSTSENSNLIIIYTDGACSRNGQKNSNAGIGVYFGEEDKRNLSEPFPFQNPTNQRAELYAPYRALESCSDDVDVEIRTDSMYTINCVTKWFQKWEKNGWQSSNNQPVENQDLIKPLLALIRKRSGKTFFIHVFGHKGEHGNEMADQLAVNGQKLKLVTVPSLKM